MEFEFTLTKEQLINFHTKHFYKTKNFLFIKRSLIILILLFFLFCAYVVNSQYTFLVISIFSTIIILILLCRKIVANYISKTRVRLALYNYENKFIFSPTKIKINNNGISIKNKINNNLIKWAGIKGLYIIENNILILTFVEHNLFIPSECIKDSDDIDLFIKLFETNRNIIPQFTYPTDINLDL